MSQMDVVDSEQITMNRSIKHDYRLEAAPAHKTMNAYALHLEMFDQLNTEEAPCDEGNREALNELKLTPKIFEMS